MFCVGVVTNDRKFSAMLFEGTTTGVEMFTTKKRTTPLLTHPLFLIPTFLSPSVPFVTKGFRRYQLL